MEVSITIASRTGQLLILEEMHTVADHTNARTGATLTTNRVNVYFSSKSLCVYLTRNRVNVYFDTIGNHTVTTKLQDPR